MNARTATMTPRTAPQLAISVTSPRARLPRPNSSGPSAAATRPISTQNFRAAGDIFPR